MEFLDCPAYLDDEGTVRCGLQAEVRCRFPMHSTDGPLESVMIRCPAGHWFNGPVGFLAWKGDEQPGSGAAAVASGAGPAAVDGSDVGQPLPLVPEFMAGILPLPSAAGSQH